jgi:hypothetical protein
MENIVQLTRVCIAEHNPEWRARWKIFPANLLSGKGIVLLGRVNFSPVSLLLSSLLSVEKQRLPLS